MAHKSSTNDSALPSSIYAIQSAIDGTYMAPQNLLDDSGVVITEKYMAFKWLVTCDTNKKYTIQVEQTKEYAVMQKQEKVVNIANNAQSYSTKSAYGKDGKIYYQVWTEDNRCFKHNGDQKTITAVGYDSTNETDFLWLFDKIQESGSAGPYKLYPGNFDYFQYKGVTPNNPLLDRSGLKDRSDDRWSKFWAKIDELNRKANGKTFYKVIFLGRHGHATNNPGVMASDRPIQDSPLTQNGFLQAFNVQAILAPQLDANGGPTINTVVYEDCREKCSTNETEHRRSKACIAQMFPKFSIDPKFAGKDPLWPEHESHKSVMTRAKHILERIFKLESKNKYLVSITAHSGIISAILSVIGFDSRSIHIVNGFILSAQVLFLSFTKMSMPPAYWNISIGPNSQSGPYKTHQDVFIILDINKRVWRLITSGKAGEYIIELVEDQLSSSGTPRESITVVGVKSDGAGNGTGNKMNIPGKPLILKREKNAGPNTPCWGFIPSRFPLSLFDLSLKDVLEK